MYNGDVTHKIPAGGFVQSLAEQRLDKIYFFHGGRGGGGGGVYLSPLSRWDGRKFDLYKGNHYAEQTALLN